MIGFSLDILFIFFYLQIWFCVSVLIELSAAADSLVCRTKLGLKLS